MRAASPPIPGALEGRHGAGAGRPPDGREGRHVKRLAVVPMD
jgi:hypothetical protein